MQQTPPRGVLAGGAETGGAVPGLAAPVTSMGLALSAFWASRLMFPDLGEAFLSSSKIAMICALLALAFAGRRVLPSGRMLLALGCALLLAQAVSTAAVLGAPLAAGPAALTGAVAGVAAGCIAAAAQYAALLALVARGPRDAAIGVSLPYLLATAADAALVAAPHVAVAPCILAFEALALPGAALCLGGAAPDAGPRGAPAAAADAGTPAPAPGPCSPFERFHIAYGASYEVFVLFMALLMLVQGAYAQFSHYGSLSQGDLYGVWSDAYALLVRAAVMAACVIAAGRMGPGAVISVCEPVWIIGLAASVLLYARGGLVVGALVLKTGLYILQVCSLVLAVQLAGRRRAEAGFIVGTMAALVLLGQASGLVFHWTGLGGTGSYGFVSAFAVLALGLLACFHVATYAFPMFGSRLSRERSQGGGSRPVGALESMGFDGADPLVQSHLAFLDRFRGFCAENDLTEREQQVLYEALRGYTAENISKNLGIAVVTVKTYLHRVYARAGVGGKQEVLAMMEGAAPGGGPSEGGPGGADRA